MDWPVGGAQELSIDWWRVSEKISVSQNIFSFFWGFSWCGLPKVVTSDYGCAGQHPPRQAERGILSARSCWFSVVTQAEWRAFLCLSNRVAGSWRMFGMGAPSQSPLLQLIWQIGPRAGRFQMCKKIVKWLQPKYIAAHGCISPKGRACQPRSQQEHLVSTSFFLKGFLGAQIQVVSSFLLLPEASSGSIDSMASCPTCWTPCQHPNNPRWVESGWSWGPSPGTQHGQILQL